MSYREVVDIVIKNGGGSTGKCEQLFTKKCDDEYHVQNFLCFFAICNFTPLVFFINSPHKSHGTEFACLLSAVFTTFKVS
ncbi:hypothetical protein BpHYR1_022586 [Brachionus plicatilis]|uniref:Uncharacterized protein n=1 Tax=Brachionus plicatilis TaxID=10195 RepID=A0A3M7T816_BRAPC|nr:hypothetical protein BpHYR1_022586 [Brachionus plicatilis]